jgi:hypothetical protein
VPSVSDVEAVEVDVEESISQEVVVPDAAKPRRYKAAEHLRKPRVGARVRIYWPSMQQWYAGTVRRPAGASDLSYRIEYDDGNEFTEMLFGPRRRLWDYDV